MLKNNMDFFLKIRFLPILSGLLLGLCFPGAIYPEKAGIWWLSPFAFVPLFCALKLRGNQFKFRPVLRFRNTTRWTTARIVFPLCVDIWMMGFVVTLIAFRWVKQPMVLYGGLSEHIAASLVFLYCCLCGLFYILLLLPFLIREIISEKSKLFFNIVLASALSTVLELFLPRFFFWQIGQLVSGSAILIQICSVFGASFLSFLIFLTSFLCVQILFQRGQTFLISLAKILLKVFCVWSPIALFGLCRLNVEKRSTREKIGILGVQPNYSFKEFFQRKLPFAEKTNAFSFNKLLELTLDGLTKNKKTDLIVWPESVLPHRELNLNKISSLVQKKLKTPILFQISSPTDKEAFASSSVLFSKEGENLSIYHKRLAMPIGETLPFDRQFPKLSKWIRNHVDNIGTLSLGEKASLHHLTKPRISLAATICFEVIRSNLMRDFFFEEATSPQILFSLLNFVWMGESSAGRLMQTVQQIRSVELGRSLVSVANTGPSFVFDGYGRLISKRLNFMNEGWIFQEVPLYWEETLFTIYGNQWILALIILNLIFYFLITQKQKRVTLEI
jgi:apolipoprotein N-acyltransferase